MKKLFILFLSAVFMLGILSSCTGASKDTSTGSENQQALTQQAGDTEAEQSQDQESTVSESTGTGEGSTSSGETSTDVPGDTPVSNAEEDIKIDTGRYVGQIDSNSVEIKISGVPDEKDPKVFRLDDKVKENFESYQLKKDDEIKIKYKMNEHNQPVIIEIEKLK